MGLENVLISSYGVATPVTPILQAIQVLKNKKSPASYVTFEKCENALSPVSVGGSLKYAACQCATQTPKMVKQDSRKAQPDEPSGATFPERKLSMIPDHSCEDLRNADSATGLSRAQGLKESSAYATGQVQTEEERTREAGDRANETEMRLEVCPGGSTIEADKAQHQTELEEKGRRAAQKRAAFLAQCQAGSHSGKNTAIAGEGAAEAVLPVQTLPAIVAAEAAGSDSCLGTQGNAGKSGNAGEAAGESLVHDNAPAAAKLWEAESSNACAETGEEVEAPPPNGAETPGSSAPKDRGEQASDKKAEDFVGAFGMQGKQFHGKITSILPPVLADLSEEARRYVERATPAAASMSDQSVSSAVQSAMGAIATAHACGGGSALGTLASSRGRIDIEVDMDAPRKDARPDRLKLVGSAAFQVRRWPLPCCALKGFSALDGTMT